MNRLKLLLAALIVLCTTTHAVAEDVISEEIPSQERLQQLLAPVALYPDTVLTHLLIAATYPIEVVQADRWAKKHTGLEGQEAVEAAQEQPWDPSVKALLAFPDLLGRMSEDLLWTQEVGEAFLASESATMDAVQALRQKALAEGTLDNMEHQEVVRDEQQIIIQPVRREVVYVPYYDSRYVYGNWRWAGYPPVYWPHPPRYHSGFYWGFYAPVGDWFYFSGFHWGHRTVVISYDRPYYHSHHHHYGYRPRYTEHWHHNPYHRRGARYHNNGARHNYGGGSHTPPRERERHEEAIRQRQHHSSRLNAIYGAGDRRSTSYNRVSRDSSAVDRARDDRTRSTTRESREYNQGVRQRVLRDESQSRTSRTRQLQSNRAPVRPGVSVRRTPERVNRNTDQVIRNVRPSSSVNRATNNSARTQNISNTRSTSTVRSINTNRATEQSTRRSTLQRATNNSRPVSRAPSYRSSNTGDRGGRNR